MKSAVMPLLYLAQKQNDNWIPLSAMKYIAKFLGMPYIKVYEVATFYSMYNLSPVGKYFIQVCTTTPCMIRGAYKLVDVCKKKISQKEKELSKNQQCSWVEVECLGACINAPMVQINDEYYEDLNTTKFSEIIEDMLSDKKPKSGSYRGRINSEPENNRITLLNNKNA
jgi:NADH-quinone oxidoreductase subunit E